MVRPLLADSRNGPPTEAVARGERTEQPESGARQQQQACRARRRSAARPLRSRPRRASVPARMPISGCGHHRLISPVAWCTSTRAAASCSRAAGSRARRRRAPRAGPTAVSPARLRRIRRRACSGGIAGECGRQTQAVSGGEAQQGREQHDLGECHQPVGGAEQSRQAADQHPELKAGGRGQHQHAGDAERGEAATGQRRRRCRHALRPR